jgi:hypothetical protein
MIMKQTVIPLKISRARDRGEPGVTRDAGIAGVPGDDGLTVDV